MSLSGVWLSILSFSTKRFGVGVSLIGFSPALALVRGLVGLLVSVLVFILCPRLVKRPFFLSIGVERNPWFCVVVSCQFLCLLGH